MRRRMVLARVAMPIWSTAIRPIRHRPSPKIFNGVVKTVEGEHVASPSVSEAIGRIAIMFVAEDGMTPGNAVTIETLTLAGVIIAVVIV